MAVLIEPVVEGVAATDFLFFLNPTQYYQQSGVSTQEVSSWNLKMKHSRPFTLICPVDSEVKKKQITATLKEPKCKNISVGLQDGPWSRFA